MSKVTFLFFAIKITVTNLAYIVMMILHYSLRV